MIYVLSGGGKKAVAAIGVTFPAGSTVTATADGQTPRTYDDSTAQTGKWFIPLAAGELGTWTLNCTDGTQSVSPQAVSITAEGQVETVELVYELWLYDEGNEFTSVTGGWSGYSSHTKTTISCVQPKGYGEVTATIANTVDFANYKTLNIHVVSAAGQDSGYGYYPRIGIKDSSGKPIGSATITNSSAKDVTVTLDVSDFYDTVGTVYVLANGGEDGWGGYLGSSVTFDKVWFSPE